MSYIEDLFSLNGMGAVVTGAGRGNGKAIAEALLRAGASVLLVDNLEDTLRKTTSNFQSDGLKAESLLRDITDPDFPSQLIEYSRSFPGNIHVLVNNAGVSCSHDTFDYPEESWEITYLVNLKAPFRISQSVAQHMKKEQLSGSIINITSLNSEVAFPNNPAYVAFKGALKQLGKSMALDFGPYGIRVNNVGPGYFRTDMTRQSYSDPHSYKLRLERTVLGRWGDPRDLAGIVVYLASSASSYVTGQDFYVDGGWLIKGL